MRRGASPFNIVSVALGLAFLYLPDHDPGHLFVQCLAAGHRLGRAGHSRGTASS